MLKEKLAKKYYELAQNEKEADIILHLLYQSLILKAELEKGPNEGLRASIRSLVENHLDEFDRDIDFEDSRLDIFYERPIFEDCRIENERDIYYYQDFNVNRNHRPNDDYILSIINFQHILEDSDLIALYMSIFKIHDYIYNQKTGKYDERDKRLIEGANYLLECGLKNIFAE